MNADSIAEPAAYVELERENGSGKRILVIDDNCPAADSLSRLLRALGWDAMPVYSAQEARDRLAEEQLPNFIFLDIGMPEMDGYELVAILRREGFEMPIIALSGYGTEDDKQKALDAGFTAHLTKPAGARELQDILGSLGGA